MPRESNGINRAHYVDELMHRKLVTLTNPGWVGYNGRRTTLSYPGRAYSPDMRPSESKRELPEVIFCLDVLPEVNLPMERGQNLVLDRIRPVCRGRYVPFEGKDGQFKHIIGTAKQKAFESAFGTTLVKGSDGRYEFTNIPSIPEELRDIVSGVYLIDTPRLNSK